MSNTIQISCHTNKMTTMKVATDLLTESGFVLVSDADSDVLYFELPRSWVVVDPCPLHFSETVEVRSSKGTLTLTYDDMGISQRTLVLSGTIFIIAMLLVVSNFTWASTVQPLSKILLPIAPWPFLVPLIHKNMGMMAHQKWNDFLRMVGRSASVEDMDLEMPDDVAPKAPTAEAETVEI